MLRALRSAGGSYWPSSPSQGSRAALSTPDHRMVPATPGTGSAERGRRVPLPTFVPGAQNTDVFSCFSLAEMDSEDHVWPSEAGGTEHLERGMGL